MVRARRPDVMKKKSWSGCHHSLPFLARLQYSFRPAIFPLLEMLPSLPVDPINHTSFLHFALPNSSPLSPASSSIKTFDGEDVGFLQFPSLTQRPSLPFMSITSITSVTSVALHFRRILPSSLLSRSLQVTMSDPPATKKQKTNDDLLMR